MSRTIEIQVQGLDRLNDLFRTAPARTRSEITKALRYSALLIQRNARMEAPVDTGILRSGIAIIESANHVTIRTSSKYAVNVHEGTGIYGPKKTPIRPTHGKVLAWKSGGKWIFARSVKGSKPNPFMFRAADKSRAGINVAFDTAVKNIIGD